MRKGADCLSKWVGEAEKQLRLLFDQARKYQPSIIFFDEIDGLTPVRSSKQDQIHSSIVSTLLALMDGLDSRGQVIVIGATNRVDAIDPALRRPGRFDRELFFDLPNVDARKEILKIHTKKWKNQIPDDLLQELSDNTKGFAGADLKSLCTEAALQALHRCFPQIYKSDKKLKISEESLSITMNDFDQALKKITPCSYRSNPQHSQSLPSYLHPLLDSIYHECLKSLQSLFPYASQTISSSYSLTSWPVFFMYSPSLSLVDTLSRSLLFAVDSCHISQFDILTSSHEGSPAEVLLSRIQEAYQHSPSILYIPHLPSLIQLIPDLVSVLIMALRTLPSSAPVLLFITAEEDLREIEEYKPLFSPPSTSVTQSIPAEMTNKQAFFNQLLPLILHYEPPPVEAPPLPVIEEVIIEEKKPEYTEEELEYIHEKEDHYFRELRNFFRELLFSLTRNSRYRCFNEPVKEEDVPDYYEIIKSPMCFDTMFVKLDRGEYTSLPVFMKDIQLIQSNAKEYNPSTTSGKRIVRAAASMVDEVLSTIHRFKRKLGYDLFERCEKALARRKEEEEERKKKPKKNELVDELMVDEPEVKETSFIARSVMEEEVIDKALRLKAEKIIRSLVSRMNYSDYDGVVATYSKIAKECSALDEKHTTIEKKIKVVCYLWGLCIET